MNPKLAYYSAYISVIAGRLTREISSLVPILLDKIQYGVHDLWGMDRGNYNTICVYDLMSRIIGQATHRVFVGLPLCRDPAPLDAAMVFSRDVPIASHCSTLSGHLSVLSSPYSSLCQTVSTPAASSRLYDLRFGEGWMLMTLGAKFQVSKSPRRNPMIFCSGR